MDRAAAQIWSDPDTYAACLLALGLDRYGHGAAADSPVHWDPDTWTAEIRDDTGVEIPVRNLDRLMGACAVLSKPDEYYSSVPTFCTLSAALAATWFEPGVWHPLSVDETLWALIESFLIHPPEDEFAYSADVVRYVNMLVKRAGFRHLPRAFETFGIKSDPSVWGTGPALDYSSEPDLAQAVETAATQRESDLNLDIADRVIDLAQRIARLPVPGNAGGVAAELVQYGERLRSTEMQPVDDDE